MRRFFIFTACVTCFCVGSTFLLYAEEAPKKEKERVAVEVVQESDDEVIVRISGKRLELGDPTTDLFYFHIQRGLAVIEVTMRPAKRIVIETNAMGAWKLSDDGKEFEGFWKAGRWHLESGDPPKRKEDVHPEGWVIRQDKVLFYHERASRTKKPVRVWKQIKDQ